jgi:hypothetical protein
MEREQRIDVEVLAMLTRLGVMVMQAWYRALGLEGDQVVEWKVSALFDAVWSEN